MFVAQLSVLLVTSMLSAQNSPAPSAALPSGGEISPAHDSSRTARALRESLDSAKKLRQEGKIDDARKALQSSFEEALQALSEDSEPSAILSRGLESASRKTVATEALSVLTRSAAEAVAAAEFKPQVESGVPEGFPALTPVGKIEVKEYPRVRAAEVASGGGLPGGRNLLFFKLFNHIQKNGISMTAPVVMTYGGASGKDLDEAGSFRMAFLYDSTRTGKPGPDGSVEVRDVGPLTVVSLGLRGEYSEERIREGLTRLEGWLAENAASYERAGDPRLLAYNSPMVPGPRKYSEIQIPVRKLQGTAEATLQTRSF